MQILLSTLAITILVGLLALVAQWSRKNRMAEISLLIVLAFVSLLLLATGALLGAVWIWGQAPAEVQKLLAVSSLPIAGSGLAGLALCFPMLRKIVRHEPNGEFWTNPPIFFGLWMYVTVLLSNNLIGIVGFEQLNQIEAFSLATGGRISPVTVLANQLPFLILAVVGVGAGIRRSPRETLARLGFGPISIRQIGVAVLFIVGAFALAVAADHLFSILQPGLYRKVGEFSGPLFNPKGLSLVSAVFFALLIGIGAGLGEETLFRGAVQPVFGITATSVLFASMHVQYGPSVLLGYVFVLSVGLGLLRRNFNTTTSFLAHAGYNTLSILAAYFFGL
jgi:membrane protease YdiL (CAAX protease family)